MSGPDKDKPTADDSAYPGDDYWPAVGKKGAIESEVDKNKLKSGTDDDDAATENTDSPGIADHARTIKRGKGLPSLTTTQTDTKNTTKR